MEFSASAESALLSSWMNGKMVKNQKKRPYIYFGDIIGNAYAIDAQTGELIWKIKADDHPNSTRTATSQNLKKLLFSDFRLRSCSAFNDDYECCTFRGDFSC